MNLYPYNTDSQRLRTGKTSIDRAFGAHFQVSAANAVAADSDGIMALAGLTTAAQEITTGITDPAALRNVTITGNSSGITGTVTVNGTNSDDEVISEDLTASGTSTVAGAKAFKTVTSVELPVRTHTPAYQTETIEITGAPSSSGTVTFAITAAALGESSPASVAVELDHTTHTTVTLAAAAIIEALNDDETVSTAFTASNEAGVITLTANAYAANDATLSIGFTDTDTTGTTAGSSTNGTAGVTQDKISVGFGSKLGLPFKLAHNTCEMAFLDNTKEGTAPTVAVSATAVESNTITLNSALSGKVVDAYFVI